MKTPILLLFVPVILGGCGAVSDLVAGPDWAPFHPGPAGFGVLSRTPTDGRWIIADEEGDRFCLTIQEGHISIINTGCRTDGGGFAVRITESPEAALAGTHLVISAAYNPYIGDGTTQKLTFRGDLQVDGTYAGTLVLETDIPADGTPDRRFRQETVTERLAILDRE